MQSERHNGLSERRQQSAYLIVARIRFLCGAAPCKTASSESFVLTNPCGRKCSLDETTEFGESLYRKSSVFAGAERKMYFPLAFQEQTLHDIVNYLVKIVSREFESKQDGVYSSQFFIAVSVFTPCKIAFYSPPLGNNFNYDIVLCSNCAIQNSSTCSTIYLSNRSNSLCFMTCTVICCLKPLLHHQQTVFCCTDHSLKCFYFFQFFFIFVQKQGRLSCQQ